MKQYVHACFLQSDQIEAIGECIEPRGATGVDLQKSTVFFFFNFYWNIAGLQWCVGFCCTAHDSATCIRTSPLVLGGFLPI